jgi:hypothetical protein
MACKQEFLYGLLFGLVSVLRFEEMRSNAPQWCVKKDLLGV